MTVQVRVDKIDYSRIYKTLVDLRSTPWFISVTDDQDWGESLTHHGFYNAFRPVVDYPTSAIYSLEFESLVTL